MAELSEAQATAMVARAGCAGVRWGAVIGVALMAVAATSDQAFGELTLSPLAALVGAVIGGMVGAVNGLVLSVCEDGADRTDLHRRVTAFFMSTAMVEVGGLVVTAGQSGWAVAVIAAIGGIAGALLAPGVVRGR